MSEKEYEGKFKVKPLTDKEKKYFKGAISQEDFDSLFDFVKDFGKFFQDMVKANAEERLLKTPPFDMVKVAEKGSLKQKFMLTLWWLNNWYIRKVWNLNFADLNLPDEVEKIRKQYFRYLNLMFKDFRVKIGRDGLKRWNYMLQIHDSPFRYFSVEEEEKINKGNLRRQKT